MLVGSWLAVTRVLAAVLLVTAALIYIRGWRRLRGHYPTDGFSLASRRSLFFFMTGLVLLGVVLVSPLAALSLQYFSARMVQHMMLIASAPSFLLLANPAPALVNGMPFGFRRTAALELEYAESGAPPPDAPRRFLYWVTSPGVTLLMFLCVCWFWYDPKIHHATITNGLLHDIELLSLFTVGVLNWWHITAALPHIHKPMRPALRVFYTFISIWPLKVVGLILLFTTKQYYTYPSTWSTSGLAINDYVFGAMIAWIVSGLAYVAAGFMIFEDFLGREQDKPNLPDHLWATDDALLAPGLERKNP